MFFWRYFLARFYFYLLKVFFIFNPGKSCYIHPLPVFISIFFLIYLTRVQGRHFFDYFLWPHKESNRHAGPPPAKLVWVIFGSDIT